MTYRYRDNDGILRWQMHPIKRIELALVKARGNKSLAAKNLGIARRTIYNYCERHPDLRRLCDELYQARGDKLEDALYRHALDDYAPGSAALKKYILSSQYRDRNWGENFDLGVPTALVQKLVSAIDDAGVDPTAALEDLLVKISMRAVAINEEAQQDVAVITD